MKNFLVMHKKEIIFILIIIILIWALEVFLSLKNNPQTSLNKNSLSSTSEEANTDEDNIDLDYEDPDLVDEMRNAVYDGDYSKAEELAAEIHELYPDSPDAKMADIYLDIAEKMKSGNSEDYAGTDFKSVIHLISVWTSTPNSAGGVDLHIKWKNTSNKTVKYAYFTCDLYNAVDDRVPCDIRGYYSFTGKITGPIEPDTIYGDGTLWENAWWNNSGKYAKITQIKIEYMDGSKIEIPQSEIDALFY